MQVAIFKVATLKGNPSLYNGVRIGEVCSGSSALIYLYIMMSRARSRSEVQIEIQHAARDRAGT